MVKISSAPEFKARVVFEDEHLVGFDKPSGIHSAAGVSPDSVEELIRQYSGLSLGPDEEYGILQRLDFETQGVLLVAKSKASYLEFRRMFAAEKVEKSYLFVTAGKFPDAVSLSGFIGAKERGARKVGFTVGMPRHGRALVANTNFKLKKFNQGLSISTVEARTTKGRRHQIRVSAAHLGFPLLGDRLYGATRELPTEFLHTTGFFLLANTVSFIHPFTFVPTVVRSLEPRNGLIEFFPNC